MFDEVFREPTAADLMLKTATDWHAAMLEHAMTQSLLSQRTHAVARVNIAAKAALDAITEMGDIEDSFAQS